MHIIVTRPLPDAWDTQARLEPLGFTTTLAPLLEIVPEALDLQQFEGASGLIVTSQNALRSLQLSGLTDSVRRLQVYCVGEATAKFAVDLKLPNVTAGRGTAADLVPVIAERHKSRPGHLVHLAGDHLAFDLAGALAEHGIDVRAVPAYKSLAARSLPPAAVAALKTRRRTAIMLMSQRTAEIWSQLSTRLGLQDELSNCVHVCMSQAVASKLQLLPATRVTVAAEPNLAEMLSTLKALAAEAAQE